MITPENDRSILGVIDNVQVLDVVEVFEVVGEGLEGGEDDGVTEDTGLHIMLSPSRTIKLIEIRRIIRLTNLCTTSLYRLEWLVQQTEQLKSCLWGSCSCSLLAWAERKYFSHQRFLHLLRLCLKRRWAPQSENTALQMWQVYSSLGLLAPVTTHLSSLGWELTGCWVREPSLKLYLRELLEKASRRAKLEKLWKYLM